MKTANKILITAFVAMIVIMIAFMFYLRANLDLEVLEGSGNVIRKNVEVADIQSVNLRGRMSVELIQDTLSRLYIDADDNLMELVAVSLQDGVLDVSMEKAVDKRATVNVFIHVQELESLNVSAGSTVHAGEALKGTYFSHHLQAGAKSTLHLQYDEVNLKLQAGALSNLSGMAQSLEAYSAAGAVIEAGKLQVTDCVIESRAGAVNNLYVTGTLSGSVGRGAVLHYSGDPELKNFRQERGSSIEVKIN